MAVDHIHVSVGYIDKISKVYSSAAVGFEGDDFFNAVIRVKTYLKPNKVMKRLLAIETSLGRKRLSKASYESRTIDLDILFYDDEIINTKLLKVPHPELHKRLFVLQPLQNIAPELSYQKFDKTVSELLDSCLDKNALESINIWLKKS